MYARDLFWQLCMLDQLLLKVFRSKEVALDIEAKKAGRHVHSSMLVALPSLAFMDPTPVLVSRVAGDGLLLKHEDRNHDAAMQIVIRSKA